MTPCTVAIDGRARDQLRPALAILIPSFNAEEYLPRALASLEANAEAHDIVIVDDGSQLPVAEAIQVGQHTVVLRTATNVGITAALNLGMSFVANEGYEYVARLDADDWSAPDRLEKQVRYLDAHPHCALVGSWYKTYDKQGNHLFDFCPNPGLGALRRELAYRNCFTHVSFMMRVDAVMRSGGYNPTFLKAEDYELVARLAQTGQVAMIPEYLTFVQVTPGSISSSRISQVIADIRVKLKYFNPRSVHSYLGVIKTSLSILIPRPVLLAIKRASNIRIVGN